ncbi:MAG: ABC transporter permease [Muribaculaceae bacterium]|nr:ABC transporter permease [Muribaculaceae bacterium]
MNYPLYLARRLSLGNGGRRMSPAVAVAIIAIAISVSVMIASIAIVLGFKREIRDKVVGFNAHISLYRMPMNEEDDNLISITPFIKETLDSFPFIKEYYEQAAIPAILKTSDDFKGVYLRGLKGEKPTDYLASNLEDGDMPDYEEEDQKNKILISRIAANQLKLNVGDKIETYFISDDIRVRKLEIAGIFNSHFDQYDDVLIFGSMNLVKQLGNLNDSTGTYLMIQTDDFDKVPDYTLKLQQRFNEAVAYGETESYYRTDNVLNQGRGFFSWLSLLDTNVVVIIILMMVVGCVTLVSGMLIIILERKKFIGLMRAMGASTSKIRNIFIYLAIKIALIGFFIGDFVIIIILYFQERYHFLQLDADSYYIDFVPVYLPGWIVIALDCGVLLVTYLVLVLPSRFVGKISPAESMVRND